MNRREKIPAVRLRGGSMALILCRAKGGREITAHRAPPRSDVQLANRLAGFVSKPLLHEPQDGSVIEDLRAHIASAAPRRSDHQWHAITETNWAGVRRNIRSRFAELL